MGDGTGVDLTHGVSTTARFIKRLITRMIRPLSKHEAVGSQNTSDAVLGNENLHIFEVPGQAGFNGLA